jgi:hypothetical protein
MTIAHLKKEGKFYKPFMPKLDCSMLEAFKYPILGGLKSRRGRPPRRESPRLSLYLSGDRLRQLIGPPDIATRLQVVVENLVAIESSG